MSTAPLDRAAEPHPSPGAGIAFMCAGVFCIAINDALAKWLGAIYPVPEVAFFRMLFALPMIVGAALVFGAPGALMTRRPLMHLGRGLLATVAVLTFFYGLTLLPLAEVTAIVLTAPLFVTVLAVPLLGERPGRAQWLATAAGFGGMLLIVRPGAAAFTLAAIAPLVTALTYGLLMLTARRLGRRETIWATMVWATAVPLAGTATLLPWFWRAPALAHLPLFVASGFFGGLAMTLITQGFRVGIASVVAPFDYTALIWATIIGWLIWGEIPAPLSIAGGLIIAGCGIYLAYRQARSSARRRAGGPVPPRGD